MSGHVLTLNAGSSSVKFALFDLDAAASGVAAATGRASPTASAASATPQCGSGRRRRDGARHDARRAGDARGALARCSAGAPRRPVRCASQRSAIASSTAAREFTGRCASMPRRSRRSTASRAGAAAPAAQRGRRPRAAQAFAERAAGRLLRHRVPCRRSRAVNRRFAMPRGCTTRASGATAFMACRTNRSSRSSARLDPALRGRASSSRTSATARRMCAIERGRVGRDDDELLAARRPDDGHALRPARRGGRAAPAARSRG